ncbi:MAG: TadE family type IV pilus minor pilin [Terracoccus sp.]
MVTAELAVALPALTLVLAGCLSALMVGVAQLRCVDAAGLAARAVARGDPAPAARELAVSAAPDGASVVIVLEGSKASVRVSATVGGWGIAPAWPVSAEAMTPVETGGR